MVQDVVRRRAADVQVFCCPALPAQPNRPEAVVGSEVAVQRWGREEIRAKGVCPAGKPMSSEFHRRYGALPPQWFTTSVLAARRGIAGLSLVFAGRARLRQF